MKVCPVCQYEEEQDSETSCAICGSDFGDSGPEETPSELEQTVEDPAPIDDVSQSEDQPEDQPEEESGLSDEEKLLEDTLAATEVSDSEKADASAEESETSTVSTIFSQISNFTPDFNALNYRLDKIFLTKLLLILFFLVISNEPLFDTFLPGKNLSEFGFGVISV